MLSRRMSVLARMAEKLNLNFEICTSDGRNHQGTDFFVLLLIFCSELSWRMIWDIRKYKLHFPMQFITELT